jgi:hypothetical protein
MGATSEPATSKPGVLDHWERLIGDWTKDVTLPLFVRKSSNDRGSVIRHFQGRSLVPTDNSPAQWAFAQAILGKKPSLEEIKSQIEADAIPVAMILKSAEKPNAKYRCTLGRVVNPNSFGWKVAHVEPVGLSTKVPLVSISESQLFEHFHKLMNPRNMFLVPTSYAGMGEIPEFCEAIRELLKGDTGTLAMRRIGAS